MSGRAECSWTDGCCSSSWTGWGSTCSRTGWGSYSSWTASPRSWLTCATSPSSTICRWANKKFTCRPREKMRFGLKNPGNQRKHFPKPPLGLAPSRWFWKMFPLIAGIFQAKSHFFPRATGEFLIEIYTPLRLKSRPHPPFLIFDKKAPAAEWLFLMGVKI